MLKLIRPKKIKGGRNMANKVTSKKLNFANNKSHANNKTNRQQKLNFQKVTIDGVTIKTTAREARTFKKNA